MMQKPKHFTSEYAETFKDLSVAKAYRYRPPYPAEIFDTLAGLITGRPGRVLDVGCGSGDIARNLVERVERLDAVDFSHHMIQEGKLLPHGNHPCLRWLHGSVEDVELDPPYGLVIAGESLHWMDWDIVLPRFHEMLSPGGYLAIVIRDMAPNPWSTVNEATPPPWSTLNILVQRYAPTKSYQPFNIIEALEQRNLFQKVGAKMTRPVVFAQSIDDYIEAFHSRSGFSRERMGTVLATAFDQEIRRILLPFYRDGILFFRIIGSVVWGLPRSG